MAVVEVGWWAWLIAVVHPVRDPIDELTARLRHPLRYALAHPLQTIERTLNTWFH